MENSINFLETISLKTQANKLFRKATLLLLLYPFAMLMSLITYESSQLINNSLFTDVVSSFSIHLTAAYPIVLIGSYMVYLTKQKKCCAYIPFFYLGMTFTPVLIALLMDVSKNLF